MNSAMATCQREQITPDEVTDGKITATFTSLSPVAVVKRAVEIEEVAVMALDNAAGGDEYNYDYGAEPKNSYIYNGKTFTDRYPVRQFELSNGMIVTSYICYFNSDGSEVLVNDSYSDTCHMTVVTNGTSVPAGTGEGSSNGLNRNAVKKREHGTSGWSDWKSCSGTSSVWNDGYLVLDDEITEIGAYAGHDIRGSSSSTFAHMPTLAESETRQTLRPSASQSWR